MGSCLSGESRSPHPRSPTTPTSGGGRKRKSRVPGRLFVNGSSEVASLFTQQGKKSTNQDAMIVWEVCSVDLSINYIVYNVVNGN